MSAAVEAEDGRDVPRPEASRPASGIDRQLLFGLFFFGVFLFLLYQLYRVLAVFLVPITWAAILGLALNPLYRRGLRLLGHRPAATAALLTTLVVMLVAVPTISLSSVLAGQTIALYQGLVGVVQGGGLHELLAPLAGGRLEELWRGLAARGEAMDIDLRTLTLRAANAASNFVVAKLTGVARNVLHFVVDFAIMGFTLFFFLRDGERFVQTLHALLPMETSHKDLIFARLYDTVSAVVQGMVATALTQGVLAGILFAVCGVPFAFFLGAASAFCALLPFGGAAIVWMAVTGWLLVTSAYGTALIVALFGVGVISSVDNLLKPWIIGERTNLPTLFLFFGVLGGIAAYGFVGIFLGPVLLAILVSFANIYREAYAGATS